jgi:CubicO group peptidase (beta-lactamase class C family)
MQAFATPLTLARTAANTWRGEVRPLEHRFHLYLRIFRREEDGLLIGALRNPELNAIGGASRFRVTRDGNKIRFRERYDDNSPEFGPDAVLLSNPARLRIKWPELDREVDLVRRAPEEVPDFFPRPPGSAPYAYARPPETGDGWRTARASETGIDEAVLTRVVQAIASSDPAVRRPSLIHSLLVAHRGWLVLEEYFYGYGRDTPHDLRSAAKTFSSVLLGAAMRQGIDIGPDTRVYPLLAGMGPFQNPDPRKNAITLAHLMTHTTGLACDDNSEDPVSPGHEDVMQEQRTQPNWWKFTLDLPQVHEPGVRYAYCSGAMSLMGAALTTATHTWLPEYFDRTIARPLQFGAWHWNLMPTDEGYLGGGAWLRPRDLLKVGQAYLDGGVWRGRRIVGASWVAQSTKPHFRISPATTGMTAEQFGNAYTEADEALAWHLTEIRAGDTVRRGYLAAGNGGQVLLVVPDVHLVAVFTGGNHRQGGIWSQWSNTIIGAQIIPAIKR